MFQTTSRMTTLVLSGVLVAWLAFDVPSALAQEARPAASKSVTHVGSEESWHVTYIDDQRVGYDFGRQHVETRGQSKIFVTDSESHFHIKRFGQEIKMTTSLRTEETEAGDLLKFTFEMKNPPIQDTKTEGIVTNNELDLTSIVAGRTTKTRMAWQPGTKSPAYPDRVLHAKPLKVGESSSTNVFLPEFSKFSKVTMTADNIQSKKLLDGKEHSLLRVKVVLSALPELNSRQFFGTDGNARMSEIDMLGVTTRTYEVTREEALQAISGEELDIAVGTLIRVALPILDAHRKQRIVYRVTAEESPERVFVAGGTQQIKRLTENSIELTVSKKAIPPANSRPVATDAKYLSASRFLQSNDLAVREHANKAAGGEADPSLLAKKLERYVFEKLTKKNFSTAMATAADVAQRMEGDCTEHAVLLAAMLRAKKVPSRIAAGLVYVDSLNAFGGHMWTEAFLAGEWIPLDATLGRGGIGAAHLKMSESAMDEDAPVPVTTFLPLFQSIGKLKIDVIKAE